MPIYEYVPALNSDNSNNQANPCCTFETLQGINEEPLAFCPSCGNPVKRIFSVFGCRSNASQTSQRSSVNCQAAVRGECNASAGCGSGACGSDSPAGRALRYSSGHVCRAGCKH